MPRRRIHCADSSAAAASAGSGAEVPSLVVMDRLKALAAKRLRLSLTGILGPPQSNVNAVQWLLAQLELAPPA
jgi:hypothetical protein